MRVSLRRADHAFLGHHVREREDTCVPELEQPGRGPDGGTLLNSRRLAPAVCAAEEGARHTALAGGGTARALQPLFQDEDDW